MDFLSSYGRLRCWPFSYLWHNAPYGLFVCVQDCFFFVLISYAKPSISNSVSVQLFLKLGLCLDNPKAPSGRVDSDSFTSAFGLYSKNYFVLCQLY